MKYPTPRKPRTPHPTHPCHSNQAAELDMQRAANTLPVQPLALTDAPNTFWSMESGASPREGERVGILTRLSDGREYPLGVGNVRIGREQSEDLVVKDRTVSRHHADLTYESGRYVLYDQSSNGTWVNGNIVVAQPLRDGDVVKFGETEYRFSWKSGATGTPASWLKTGAGKIMKLPTLRMKAGKARPHGRSSLVGCLVRQVVAFVLTIVLMGTIVYFTAPDLAQQAMAIAREFLASR